MADYTIELKDVIALGHNIFDFNYPFYDERKRPEFEERFIRHFYFREIGCPTIDRFKVYLRDKMETVFPYYNKLFETSLVEYDLLNNYNLTEEITTERENEGKTRGESYTVGRLEGEQNTQSVQNRVTDTEGNVSANGKETNVETTHSETDNTTHAESDRTQNVNGTTTETDTETKSNTRKFLDTPQGLTNLSDSNYLTDLTHVAENNSITKSVDSDTDTTGHDESDTTGHSETNATHNGERNTESNQDSTGKETTNDTVSGSVKDEQKSTQDNNTRTYAEGKAKEIQKLTRIGNIGVQTGADMIRIHVDLQKTLRNIERMFFDECEDLFMLVY